MKGCKKTGQIEICRVICDWRHPCNDAKTPLELQIACPTKILLFFSQPMKFLCLLFCFGLFCLNAVAISAEIDATRQTHFQIAPLMPLSKDLPIEISDENLQKHIHNPESIAESNARAKASIKSRTIPWSTLIATFAVLLTIVLIKNMPRSIKLAASQNNSQPPHVLALNALNELAEELAENHLQLDEKYNAYFSSLDHIIRNYLEGTYHIKASSCTTQEFLQQIATSTLLDDEAKRVLASFLQSTDRIKFADHHPSLEECHQAMQTAKKLISDAH